MTKQRTRNTPEQSAEAVRKAMRMGARTVEEIVRGTDLSRVTVQRWLNLMVDSGEAELADTRPGKHPYGAGMRQRIFRLTDQVQRDPLTTALFGMV